MSLVSRPRLVDHARRAGLAAALGLALCTAAGSARASEEEDTKKALDLFEQGRKLMTNNATLNEACTTLEASLKLFHRGDTLLNLAECHRRQGKTASAWTEFDRAIAEGKKVGFTRAMQIARQLRDELGAKLSRITVTVSPEMAALPDLVITLNGREWPKDRWNKEIIVDPGAIEIGATAKGYLAFKGQLELGTDKDAKSFPVVLEKEPPPPPPPKKVVWPWIVGGIGVGMAGASVGFLVDQHKAGNELDARCGATRKACPLDYEFGPVRSRELRDFGLFVGLGVGGVLAITAGGLGLGLSSPSAAPAQTGMSLQIGPASLQLKGDF